MIATTLSRRVINQLLQGKHSTPFSVLGMHEVSPRNEKKTLVVRAMLPGAWQVFVIDVKKQQRYPMNCVDERGLFEIVFSRRRKPFAYQLEVHDRDDDTQCLYDAYAFPPLLAEDELRRFQDARHDRIYEHLGSHPLEVQGICGTRFAVWAPNAKRVSVIGAFNNWNGLRHPMRLRKKWGVWELFIPGIEAETRYQYEILSRDGRILVKSDPYAFSCEQAPDNSSIVVDMDCFEWDDREWLEKRAENAPLQSPLSVYEVHLGSWLKKAEDAGDGFLSYRELARELIPYVKSMGFSHIELLPVAEHPFYASWGYQVTGYYAPSSRYGSPQDFKFFINECHHQGIGVIADWVPAHFPKDDFSLSSFDGSYLYEHEDPMMAEHKDWGTLIFDYGRNEVKNFLLANALFWFQEYHIDGIRVDAVASMLYLDYSRPDGEWTPNKYGGRENLEAIDFLKEFNAVIHEQFPGAMSFAEESTSWLGVTYPAYLGGLGFGFKWNLGWMNDMLHYLSKDPLYRKFVHTMVPFALLYAFHEHFILELSHDEVVHGKGSLLGKMPGDEEQKFANLRLLYGFMFGHPGKKLLFMGSEFGQRKEWDHDSSLEWDLLQDSAHQGVQRFVRDLNHLYRAEPALYHNDIDEWSFQWIDYHDFENSVFSFMRKAWDGEEHLIVAVFNFTPVTREKYRIGVPCADYYRETLNSDAGRYGGSETRNRSRIPVESIPWQQQTHSILLTLPPLGAVFLKPVRAGDGEQLAIRESAEFERPAPSAAKSGLPEAKSAPTQIPPRPGVTGLTQYLSPASDLEANARDTQRPSSAGIKEQSAMLPKSRIARPQGSKAAITQHHDPDNRKSSG
ncbi:MAG: 1,4-alpha-glucan branching protein GlgB [bacterium]|nr:1,4-alpha-glucan branching protein GlgB [bacterium]